MTDIILDENGDLIDLGEFDPRSVFQLLVALCLWAEDAYVAKWVPAFEQGYANAMLNWKARKIRIDYLPPREKMYIPINYEHGTVGAAVYGPELVLDPVPPAPWDIPDPPPPPEGLVVFGPPIGGNYDGYLDGGSTVEKGHEAEGPDGRMYKFYIAYRPVGVTKYWLAT